MRNNAVALAIITAVAALAALGLTNIKTPAIAQNIEIRQDLNEGLAEKLLWDAANGYEKALARN